ncbi:hypothetical protein COL26b_002468 [Colletotrichum chrysophilum]|uniref:uncharacterized protein n=1 Tax=Colletotrichum chrysophilum TaxID=1836956 RepID=UPI002300C652|nr:uncharacterized protein COL26b_002468 [Colletotrichum chrysophilum]KAJ0379299.1 hypothetical protein COL26b_002468 [Colletotrichum chrysophilum]
MTEKPQPVSTQLATPSQTLFAPPSVPVSTHDVPRKVETVEEEEPYTIKCICHFSDDDGNTIYCETCDTWQHIECFYPNSREEALREDFAHSPATTPPDLPSDFQIHNYSDGFLNLTKKEVDAPEVETNSFASLNISNTMSIWLREPERMRQETGEEFNDVFAKLPADIESRKRPLQVESKKLSLGPDTVLPWQYLATPAAIEKDVPLIELNGQIGFQKDYCADPANLWEELSSPLPFVFFHPMLPLYIDTRREGSKARFVRRSCKPNAVLDTYLNGQSEYHFWLVSDRYIAANEQITLPWDFRLPKKEKARILHLLGLGDDDTRASDEPDMNDVEYQRISGWVYRILSEYGGCACDLGANCAFARFHRHYHAKMQSRPIAPKKKRKAKTHTISPTSTGHATNSRAASEGHQDDPEADGKSVSERSKPPSRDRTPARQGSLDRPGILTEPTDRDKRKVQMVEDSFRRLEQQPPRKKKRTSDGTGSTKSKQKSTTSNASTGTGNYVDAGTSRSKSNSPVNGASPPGQNPFKTPASRNGSVATQSGQPSTTPMDIDSTADQKATSVSSPTPSKDTNEQGPNSSPLAPSASDIPMTDAPTSSPSAAKSPVQAEPTADVQVNGASSPLKTKSPELRVQMPPVPAFNGPTTGPASATTPSSASTTVQSPFSTGTLPSPFAPSVVNGVAAHPSPAKKKLSLSDYTKSRMNKKPAGGLKTSLAGTEESKPNMDSIVGSPATEKSAETLPPVQGKAVNSIPAVAAANNSL